MLYWMCNKHWVMFYCSTSSLEQMVLWEYKIICLFNYPLSEKHNWDEMKWLGDWISMPSAYHRSLSIYNTDTICHSLDWRTDGRVRWATTFWNTDLLIPVPGQAYLCRIPNLDLGIGMTNWSLLVFKSQIHEWCLWILINKDQWVYLYVTTLK